MTNLRSSTRYDCRLDIEYGVGDQKQKSFTKNLSLGGVFIESEQKFVFGTKVQVRFNVPTQKEAVEATGVMRWAEPSGFGVQFDGLRARDVWALGKYFETLPK